MSNFGRPFGFPEGPEGVKMVLSRKSKSAGHFAVFEQSVRSSKVDSSGKFSGVSNFHEFGGGPYYFDGKSGKPDPANFVISWHQCARAQGPFSVRSLKT